MYVKSGKTSTEKHHVEIFTCKAIYLSEHPLAKAETNSAPLQEHWRPGGTQVFQNQSSFSADLDRLQHSPCQFSYRKKTEKKMDKIFCFLSSFFRCVLGREGNRQAHFANLQDQGHPENSGIFQVKSVCLPYGSFQPQNCSMQEIL